MKIGILLCGDVPQELMEEFGNYVECLRSQLKLNQFGSVSVWNVYQDIQLPADVYECDVYIVGGSPSGVNDDLAWVKSLSDFIRLAFDAKKKLFGMCFGHQIINHALGGIVEKSEKGWGLGPYDVQLRQDIGAFKAGQTLKLIAMHQDQVVKPGEHFEVLAGSEFCPNYITRFQDQVLTVQGHPEFSRPFFNALLNQRKDKFETEEIERGLVKEETFINSSLFNRYVNDFLFS